MLISHPCKFIYLKTRKTGGTSVEIYFEPYCVDPKNRAGDVHNRDAEISEWGVVGSRGSPSRPWYNHMPASEVRELVGEVVWRQYLKFCVVRHPFDKVVSYFWFDVAAPIREALRGAAFSDVRQMFQHWTALGRFPMDQEVYTIGNEVAVDRILRFERLEQDMGELCGRLSVPWQPGRIGRFKSEYRMRREPFFEYYGPAAAARVREAFAWEMSFFGYSAE